VKLLLSIALCWFTLVAAPAADQVLDLAAQLELKGSFTKAGRLLDEELTRSGLVPARRASLEFERDRLERIRKDYPHTREELFSALGKSVSGLTRAEFDRWEKQGRFDSRVIDRKRRYMGSSVSNLFFRYPELKSRRMPYKDDESVQRAYLATARGVTESCRRSGTPYALAKTFQVSMKVTVAKGAVPAGEKVKAWLPVPRDYPFQTGFELQHTSGSVLHLADGSSPIRSVLLEQIASSNAPTQFSIDYRYTSQGVHFTIDPAAVTSPPRGKSELAQFVQEAPHVQFTEGMRALSKQILAGESNPAKQAKKFYDWIATNIKYSYALEYSTIRNISAYCAEKGYGDCGQEALLFITLCRLNGIPARWQSGWNTFPDAKSIHDWAEIYLEPYGWMPVDPYMGIYAMRYCDALLPREREELRDFYFGGLDQFRMIANCDHNQVLQPLKTALRSDTVDFQRGELEVGGRNIYFDKYDYQLTATEIARP